MRPWSFSRLNTAEECLAQYNYQYRERLPPSRPSSPAANRGILIHEKADLYLKNKLPIYPAELQKVAGHAMLLKRLGALGEQKYAVNEKWEPLDFNEKDAMLRGIVDVVHVSKEIPIPEPVPLNTVRESTPADTAERTIVGIEDWKSGQVYPDHPKQLELYVGLVAPFFPEADEFRTRLIYTDQAVVTPIRVVSKARAEGIKTMLDGRIKKIEEVKTYPVSPGPHCRFCNYSKRFGGPCAH